MKNILILNGSPRPRGNTVALIHSFVKGAEEAGHEVSVCNIRGMNIAPCMGCLRGGQDPASPCVQKDDMDIIYKLYRECDLIVFASPLYFWGFTAQLKKVIDRLFAAMEDGAAIIEEAVAAEDASEGADGAADAAAGTDAAAGAGTDAPADDTPSYQANLTAKECMMIVPAEEDHDANFELINQYFTGFCERMGWKDCGRLTVGGLMKLGDIKEKPEALEAAYNLGKSIEG